MKTKRLTSDRISNLPQNIVDKILTLMPIRDALRTSILSKKWRYCWKNMPKLAFDDSHVKVPCDSMELEIYKLVNTILHILLLHKGPLGLFEFVAVKLDIGSEFDPIIHHLSRIDSVRILNLEFAYQYKLPHSFFSLNGLVQLRLCRCELDPPLMFNGLDVLREVIFNGVAIKAKKIRHFFANCPLEEVELIGYVENFEEGNESTFVELLRCLPSVTWLHLSKYYMKYTLVGPMQHKLSTSLVNLKDLYLNGCFIEQDEIGSTLCLIRSSPTIKRIVFLGYGDDVEPRGQPTSMNFFDPQDYSDLYLGHLQELEIHEFHFLAQEMEFVKLIMAKSPLLKEASLVIDKEVSVDKELEMLRGLIQCPFPRASPSAKLTIKRPKP